MRNLLYYFTNPFKALGISINELARFTMDHLARLTEDPHPGLNGLIAPTSAAMTAFDAMITDNDTRGALRKMRVLIKENFRKTVTSAVDLIMGGVRRAMVAGNRPPEEETLYLPNGLSPFSRVPDDRLENELERFRNALADNVAVVGQALVDEAQDLLDAWNQIYADNDQATAQKAFTEREQREAKDALAEQLNTNLHTLTLVFPEDEGANVWRYMQQTLLGGPKITPIGGGGGTPGGGDDDESSSDSSEDEFDSSSSSEDEFESSSSSEDDFESSSSSEFEPPSSSSSSGV